MFGVTPLSRFSAVLYARPTPPSSSAASARRRREGGSSNLEEKHEQRNEPMTQPHVLEDTMGFFERWWAYLLGGFILMLMAVGEG